jgi:hypothetical protein
MRGDIKQSRLEVGEREEEEGGSGKERLSVCLSV